MPIVYDKERWIGEGTYGQVYHGEWNNRSVAVKKVKAASQIVERELNLRSLSHPNVVQLLGFEDKDDQRYVKRFLRLYNC